MPEIVSWDARWPKRTETLSFLREKSAVRLSGFGGLCALLRHSFNRASEGLLHGRIPPRGLSESGLSFAVASVVEGEGLSNCYHVVGQWRRRRRRGAGSWTYTTKSRRVRRCRIKRLVFCMIRNRGAAIYYDEVSFLPSSGTSGQVSPNRHHHCPLNYTLLGCLTVAVVTWLGAGKI